jgi:hypothetical protein
MYLPPDRREFTVPASAQEIYQRYLWASALTRNADAVAEMFALDGVLEAPLVPAGRAMPRRLEGREEIRKGLADYYERWSYEQEQAGLGGLTVNREKSRSVVHTTADPDVFIVEIDTAFDGSDGIRVVSLVKIFRMREGKIRLLRDYFSPDLVR